MSAWSSTITTSGDCSACCSPVGCPCDTSLFPSTLYVDITLLTGVCTGMTGSTMTMHRTGTESWAGDGFGHGSGTCPPEIQCDFVCINISGTYYFQITMAWSPDLGAGGIATFVSCGPPVDIEFTLNLVWSGVNGSTLCCPQTDTNATTILGTIKVKVHS